MRPLFVVGRLCSTCGIDSTYINVELLYLLLCCLFGAELARIVGLFVKQSMMLCAFEILLKIGRFGGG